MGDEAQEGHRSVLSEFSPVPPRDIAVARSPSLPARPMDSVATLCSLWGHVNARAVADRMGGPESRATSTEWAETACVCVCDGTMSQPTDVERPEA